MFAGFCSSSAVLSAVYEWLDVGKLLQVVRRLCLGCFCLNTLTVGESKFGAQETHICPKYNPEWGNRISTHGALKSMVKVKKVISFQDIFPYPLDYIQRPLKFSNNKKLKR